MAKATKSKVTLSKTGQATLAMLNAGKVDGHGAKDTFDLGSLPGSKGQRISRTKAAPDFRQPSPDLLQATGDEHIATAHATKAAKQAGNLSTHDAGLRSDPAKQIAAIKSAIDAENAYIRNLLSRGDFEQAAARIVWQQRRKARIGELSTKWALYKMQAAEAAKPIEPRKAKLKIERKVKRYARWSDK